jgi:hypothetical protein
VTPVAALNNTQLDQPKHFATAAVQQIQQADSSKAIGQDQLWGLACTAVNETNFIDAITFGPLKSPIVQVRASLKRLCITLCNIGGCRSFFLKKEVVWSWDLHSISSSPIQFPDS